MEKYLHDSFTSLDIFEYVICSKYKPVLYFNIAEQDGIVINKIPTLHIFK